MMSPSTCQDKTQESKRRQIFEHQRTKASIVSHTINGHPTNTLALQLPEPRRSLSGLHGVRRISGAANCCLPASLQKELGISKTAWKQYYTEVANLLFPDVPSRHLSILSTGVNIDYIAVQTETLGNMEVTALVTAGTKSNALRIGEASAAEEDSCLQKAGTINIIIITNASLPVSAMAASFITATEAKVIALQELDIKSTFSPKVQATGTGTDTILVISGKGPKQEYVGGHTQLGMLMARAVTGATINALRNTNGL